MSITSLLARSSLAAVAVVISGCRLSDVQDPATLPTLAAGRASAAAQPDRDKVDICHRTNGESDFILISVASPAVDAHVAHGDGRPGEAFPGQPGMRFGPTCQPEIIPFDVTLFLATRGVVRDANHDGIGDAFVPGPSLESVNGFAEEQRAILEFGIGQFSQPVGHADLIIVVDTAWGVVPFNVDIYSYAGDGTVTLSDFAAGSIARSFVCTQNRPQQITLDVTAALNSLIASHATYVGFNFRSQAADVIWGPRPIFFDAFYNPPWPTTRLHVRSP